MNLSSLSNEALIKSLKSLVGDERGVVVAVLRHLSEFESRRLAVDSGFPSLFDYCVRELRYAQGEAFRRIRAARAAEKFKLLYDLIEDGSLTLTTVAMLEPHLKWENYRKLIRAAKGLSTREVEALVSSLNPVAAAPVERIRILTVAAPPVRAATTDDLFPAPVEGSSEAHMWLASTAPLPVAPGAPPPAAPAAEAPAAPAAEAPAAPAAEAPAAPAAEAPAASAAEAPATSEAVDSAAQVPRDAESEPPLPPTVRRVLFSFTGGEALLRDFERAKDLTRHRWPAGKQEDVFAGALKVLLEKIDPDRRRRRRERARRLAAGARSRGIAQAVKDVIWERDGGRCVYVSSDGRVCGARAGLEFDHVRPWALGGSGEAGNVRLLCRMHNALEARKKFGDALVDAAVARRRTGGPGEK